MKFLAFATAEPFSSWNAASVLKGVVKYGKKQFAIDENKRDTYKDFLDSGHGPSVMATLEGDWKQLMAVCTPVFRLSRSVLFFFFFFFLSLYWC